MADVWSMPAWRAFELSLPTRSVTWFPASRGCSGAASCTARVLPFYHSLYPGLVITLLAIFALVVRGRFLWPWLALALFGFVTALGHNFPVWHLVRRLPLVAQIRFPKSSRCCFAFPGHAGSVWIRLRGVGPGTRAPVDETRAAEIRCPGSARGLCRVACAQTLAAHFPEGQTLRDCLRVSLVALASLLPLWLARRLGRLRRALALCACLRST